MPWVEWPIVGGVVLTRDDSVLQPGELTESSNLRLIPGDNRQVVLDEGRTRLTEGVGGVAQGITRTIVAMEVMTFINSVGGRTKVLFVITTDGSSSYFQHTALDGDLFTTIQTITPAQGGDEVVTRADIVKVRNEYFILTNVGNYVINSALTSRVLGLDDYATAASDSTLLPADATITATQAEGAGGSDGEGHDQYDYYAYSFTEYDSTNDVESAPVAYGYLYVDTEDQVAGWDLSVNWTQQNSSADKIRVYRTFVGNTGAQDLEVQSRAVRIALGKEPRVMGFIKEFAISDISSGTVIYEPTDLGDLDTANSYPLVNVDVFSGGGIFEYLVKPAACILGTTFQNCLVTVKVGGANEGILFYSPPGGFEYQPAPYFIHILGDDGGRIVGLSKANDGLVVLSNAGVYRVNYLPFQGFISGSQGRAVTPITTNHGCVGRKAYTTVETTGGELVVWLTQERLVWSDGAGWDDACPDFSANAARFVEDIDKSVLINNPKKYRLELYQPAQPQLNIPMRRWDFYYHSSLLKNGKMRLMGPTELLPDEGEALYGGTIIDAAVGRDYNEGLVIYTTDGVSIWKEGVGNPKQDATLTTGYMTLRDRFQVMKATKFGLTHTESKAPLIRSKAPGQVTPPGAPTIATCTVRAAVGGNNPVEETVTMPGGLGRNETSDVAIPKTGHWLQVRWAIQPRPFAIGPAWVKLEGGSSD